ncbi:hypothetical protein Droror1_Dr00010859 [Drosera rotundifolia]
MLYCSPPSSPRRRRLASLSPATAIPTESLINIRHLLHPHRPPSDSLSPATASPLLRRFFPFHRISLLPFAKHEPSGSGLFIPRRAIGFAGEEIVGKHLSSLAELWLSMALGRAASEWRHRGTGPGS